MRAEETCGEGWENREGGKVNVGYNNKILDTLLKNYFYNYSNIKKKWI